MATVYDILRLGGTPADYSMSKLDESTLKLKSSDPVPGGQKTTYIVATDDQTHPTTFVIQAKADPKGQGGKGVNALMIALNSWARMTIDGVVSDVQPISCVLTINMPASLPVETADVRLLMENCYSLTYASLNAKIPESARLAGMALYGLTTL